MTTREWERLLYKGTSIGTKFLEILIPILAWHWFGWKVALLTFLLGLCSAMQGIYWHYSFREEEENERKTK